MFGFLNKKKALSYPASPPNGWWRITEPFSGAWQQNIEYSRETVLANFAVFACTTLIASDISKLRLGLVKKDSDGIWTNVPIERQYPSLSKPNKYQNMMQFFECWLISKLSHGNTYVLMTQDRKNLYILNPRLVQPLVSTTGEIFYQLTQDNLSDLPSSITVPASEIIHDRFNCLYHWLVGLSPLYASGLAAYGGIQNQENSARFFKNQSQPGGILVAPGAISDETAARMKAHWAENFTGANAGKVAVLGDGLKYEKMAMTAEQSQMVEQLKLTADIVCSTYHVPSYKVIGDPPSFNNIEALEQQYYSQCLQTLIEAIEFCLDEAFELPEGTETRFDLDGLLRMDSATQTKTLTEGIKGGLHTPNEARKKINAKPLEGGDTIYMQEQNYSMEALAKRDAKDDPFGTETPPPQTNSIEDIPDPEYEDKSMLEFLDVFTKELKHVSG